MVQLHTMISVCNTSAWSMLQYGSEAWTVCKRYESRIPQQKWNLRRRVGYTRLAYETDLDIMKELNTQPLMEFIEELQV